MKPVIRAQYGNVRISYGGCEIFIPREVLVSALDDLGLAIQNSGDICDPRLVGVAELLRRACEFGTKK